jgi:hypothetical protein
MNHNISLTIVFYRHSSKNTFLSGLAVNGMTHVSLNFLVVLVAKVDCRLLVDQSLLEELVAAAESTLSG